MSKNIKMLKKFLSEGFVIYELYYSEPFFIIELKKLKKLNNHVKYITLNIKKEDLIKIIEEGVYRNESYTGK